MCGFVPNFSTVSFLLMKYLETILYYIPRGEYLIFHTQHQIKLSADLKIYQQ
jgi:hypothetical protein